MATRVDKTVNLASLPENSLIRRLRSRAGKKEINTDFIGLKRSNALSDVDNPGKSLDNTLSRLNPEDEEERQIYGGNFDGIDWIVTRNFTEENITKEFLEPLFGVSANDGIVSLNPRIRIEDRISQVNSFLGIDSFKGLHSGPTAQFYRSASRQKIGFIKFDVNPVTGEVTVSELKEQDRTSDLDVSEILRGREKAVLILENYEVSPGNTSNLSGSGIQLSVDSGENWSVEEGLSNLISLRNILTSQRFSDTYFFLTREYSVINPPPWYAQSPSDSELIPGGADDLNPVTSFRVLNSSSQPVTINGYWYSRAYVDSRWTGEELRRMRFNEENVVQDSNMKWESLPSPLKIEQRNWGIRWDGYLYITPGNYAFQVETNASVKIDVFTDQWVNVFDKETSAEIDGKLISQSTFDSDDIDAKFKYFFSEDEDDWEAYLPITIRFFVGGADKSAPGIPEILEPDLFIKTTRLNSATNFHSKTYSIELSGEDEDWQIVSEDLEEILDILGDENASVSSVLVGKEGVELATPVAISIQSDGTSNTSGLEETEYTLKLESILPTEFSQNRDALWRGRIASPENGKFSYEDLVSGDYSPNQQKNIIEFRPDWWKTSEGHPYDRSFPPSPINTPLDGFATNLFSPVLKSPALGLGLYGDGDGNYSERPNIILGESRYNGEEYSRGSNYTGITLKSNRFGEGGKLIIDAFPVNNATYSSPSLLGEDDLGGSPNQFTSYADKTISNIARLYLWSTGPDENRGKYYLHVDLDSITVSDDPEDYGLPPFSSPDWLSPVTISSTQVCDNSDFTGPTVKDFVAPLSLSVEKVEVPGKTILGFSVNLESISIGGSEVSQFSGKFVRYYTQSNSTFQFSRVDSGESLSFSDVLKITYDENDNIVFPQSEIPQPPSERVTPFGFDLPQRSSGICYPPYLTSDPILSEIAVDDNTLYSSTPGWYDVFWGDVTRAGLGGKTLTIEQNLEFQGDDTIQVISEPIPSTLFEFYTHKFRVDMDLSGTYDEDVLEYLGNSERVKDSYFLYANVGVEPVPDPVIPDENQIVPIGPDPGEGIKPGTDPLPGGGEGGSDPDPGVNPDPPDDIDDPGILVEGNIAPLATTTSTFDEEGADNLDNGVVSPNGSRFALENLESE
jgi:hypothetical protein